MTTAAMAREVFKIVDLVVTFQEEPGLDVYLIFELQDAKVKTSVRPRLLGGHLSH